MIVLRHAVEIAAPREAVWARFAALAEWPEWFPFLHRVRALSPQAPFAVGARLVLELQVPVLGAVPIEVRIERSRPGLEVSWSGAGFGVRGVHTYTLEGLGETRSRLTSHETLSGWAARILPAAVRARIEEETRRSLERFRVLADRPG